jgi:nucleotide-binding universal stress UspA family protein
MAKFETILLTTDFSETSKSAFSYALRLAEKFDSRIVVAYVEEDKLPPLVVEYTAVGLDEIMRDQQEQAHGRLREFVDEQLPTEREVETRVAAGTPHVEIIRLAEECGADLILMATHGRGFISHAILGSTTERVLRRAPCPVFAVRCPEETGE